MSNEDANQSYNDYEKHDENVSFETYTLFFISE